jgi:class 3 adenylate cyclase
VPTWEEWADDLKVVLDATDSHVAALFAVADGGPMAITFAASHPERTKALVLFNTGARTLVDDDYPHGLPPGAKDLIAELREQCWGTEDYAALLSPSVAGDPLQMSWFAKYMRATASPRATAAQMRAYSEMDVRFVLSSVRAPTLVLHRRDLGFPPVSAGRYLAGRIPGARFAEIPGTDTGPQTEYADLIVDSSQEFLTGVRPSPQPDRFLRTVLFTDIVDSTRLSSTIGDSGWHKRLDAHDQLIRRELQRFRGTEIKTTGDGFLATFDGPGRAIQCCRAIRDAARPLGLTIRLGLHTGEVEQHGEDIRGVTVNIGARVAALARPSEVLVSRTVADLVAGSGFNFEDRGEYELKGVPGAWRLFAVVD